MKSKKVLMLCDATGAEPTGLDFKDILKDPDWKTERNCYDALVGLGHSVKVIAIYDDIYPLLTSVWEEKPDIIFNLVESFCGLSFYERNIVGLLELLKIPYTGSNPAALVLCKNKAITKEILSHHHINVSKFKIIYRGSKIKRPKWLKFPLIVKPLREEASTGISNASLISSDEEFAERIKFIHQSLAQDAIAESYISGRELYVSMIGNRSTTVFPIRELILPDSVNGPHIATYKVKWDAKYRKKWKIRYQFAQALDPDIERKIIRVARNAYKILRIQGYARIDLRLTPEGEVYIIEANPNPGIAKDEDFTLSAKKAGLEYPELIQKIVDLGLEYSQGESIQE